MFVMNFNFTVSKLFKRVSHNRRVVNEVHHNDGGLGSVSIKFDGFKETRQLIMLEMRTRLWTDVFATLCHIVVELLIKFTVFEVLLAG